LLRILGDSAVGFSHDDLDITSFQDVNFALEYQEFNAVINCAAYNQVDRAEDEEEKATEVNSFGPLHLGTYCKMEDVKFLHVSTDYVFGQSEIPQVPYREGQTPIPACIYSQSKHSGEDIVQKFYEKHFIVRTCGLYGHAAQPTAGNFVEKMLQLAETHSQISVVNDQRCTPTSSSDLAEWLVQLIQTEEYGLYHATNSSSTTWYEFACEIFRLAGIDVEVQPISTAEFGAKAKRPVYSVLDCSKLKDVLQIEIPTWQDALARYLTERNENS